MERSITDAEFVLYVCTPKYCQRSSSREGGVGYEGGIITGELFAKQNHGKFIPILRCGTDLPTWATGSVYTDLRGDSQSTVYIEQYARLVETLKGTFEKAPPLSSQAAPRLETPLITVEALSREEEDAALRTGPQIVVKYQNRPLHKGFYLKNEGQGRARSVRIEPLHIGGAVFDFEDLTNLEPGATQLIHRKQDPIIDVDKSWSDDLLTAWQAELPQSNYAETTLELTVVCIDTHLRIRHSTRTRVTGYPITELVNTELIRYDLKRTAP